MRNWDDAIKATDYGSRLGEHYLTYKDIDGNKVTERFMGAPGPVERRKEELKNHGCKIIKVELYKNWSK